STGGRCPKDFLLETLPADLQIAWLKLDADRRAADTDAGLVEPEPGLSPDSRLQQYVAALTRFSPPQYTLEQREAVERRCIELGKLCDEGLALINTLKRATGISVASPGSREAGLNRAYHPALAKLAKRTASNDLTYTSLYPSAAKPISISTFLRLIKEYRKHGLVAFIRQRQTLSPAKDDRFLDVPQ